MHFYLDTHNNGAWAERFTNEHLFWTVGDSDDLIGLNTLERWRTKRAVQTAARLLDVLDGVIPLAELRVNEVHIPIHWLQRRGVRWFRERLPLESTKVFAYLSNNARADLESLLYLSGVNGYALHDSQASDTVIKTLLSTGLPLHIHDSYDMGFVYHLGQTYPHAIRSISTAAPLCCGLLGVALHPQRLQYHGTIYNEDLPEYSHYTGITNWNIRVFEGWCRGVQIPPAPFL